MTPVMNPKQTCQESVKNNQNQASYVNCSTTKSVLVCVSSARRPVPAHGPPNDDLS